MDSNTLRIGELHYHFRRCGVRTVIENLLRGLIAYGPFEDIDFDLISSDAQQAPGLELVNALHAFAIQQHKEVPIHPIELPELDYQMEPAANREQLFAEASELSQQILSSLQLEQQDKNNPYVLQVHNANLGKNPRLTLALKLLADRLEQEDLPAWILYQMHDFAEDHRPTNWAALCNCSGEYDRQLAVEMMYPTSSRVLWACINSTDREKLISIGLNPEVVSLLPNSVDVATFSSPALMSMTDAELEELHITRQDFASDLKERIGMFARNKGFTFDSQRKILLAPIKTLRRKNVIESVLLLSALNLQEDRYQLLVTLPGASTVDVEYCQAIEEFVKRNQLPVVIGFGEELLAGGNQRVIESGEILRYGLIDLLYISEAVVTTSIQEGFGYVFHEPWLAGKAVLGRNIPNVTRDFCAAGMQLNHLYDHLLIPWSLISDIWPEVVEAYQRKVIELRKSAALTMVSNETLTNQINRDKTYKLYNRTDAEEKYIDWADLPWRMQLLVLQEFIANARSFQEILWVNDQLEPLRDWYPSDISDIIIQNQRIVQNHYGLAKVIETYSGLMAEGKKRVGSKRENRHSRLSNDGVFALSLEPKHLRLLA
jgi:hypothetical protein